MASATLTLDQFLFPNGTTVYATPQEFNDEPVVAVVASNAVSFDGLHEDTPYLARARVAGRLNEVRFRSSLDSSGSSGVILPWAANTAYKQGQPVTYSGQTYTAKADFTSGGAFSAANWNLLPLSATPANRQRLTDEQRLFGYSLAVTGRAAAPADIVWVDDSTGEGTGATGITKRALDVMMTALRGRYPTAGLTGMPTTVGGIPGGGVGYLPAYSGAFGSGVTYIPTTTGTTAPTTRGPGHRSTQLNSAGATWTQPARGYVTSVGVLIYRSGTADAYTIEVKNSANAVIASTTVAAGAAAGYVWWTSGALTRGAYTIVVTQTAGTPHVCGSMHFDGDENKGIRLWDGSKAGSKVNTFCIDAASQGSQEWANALTAIGMTPDLIVQGCLLNDANSGDVNAYSPASYADNLQRFINLCRTRWPNVPMLFVSKYRRPTVAAKSGTWDDYINAMRDVAAANDYVGYLNIDALMPPLNPDTYGFLADATHPNNNGYAFLGRIYGETLATAIGDGAAVGISEAPVLRAPTYKAADADGLTAETIDAATGAATTRSRWTRNGVLRWVWDMFGTETGSNAGGDLLLRGYDDTGGIGPLVATVKRSSGIWSWAQPPKLPNYTTAGRPTTNLTAGLVIYDTTLGKPVFRTASAWIDAAGNVV